MESEVARWRSWSRSEASWTRIATAAALVAVGLVCGSFGGVWLPIGLLVAAYALSLVESEGEIPVSAASLMRKYIDHDRYRVAIKLTRDGVAIGGDEGVAWFEGGLLRYAGRRIDFGIAPRPHREDSRLNYLCRETDVSVIQLESAMLAIRSQRHCPEGTSLPAEDNFAEAVAAWSQGAAEIEKEIVPCADLDPETVRLPRSGVWIRQILVVAVPTMLVMLCMPANTAFNPANRWAAFWTVAATAAVLAGGVRVLVLWRERRYRERFPDDPMWTTEGSARGIINP